MLGSGGEVVRIDPMNSEVAETNSSLRKVMVGEFDQRGDFTLRHWRCKWDAYPLGKYS